MRDASEGRCIFCDEPVNPELDYQRVVGWERHRKQGGTNALRCREVQAAWACRWCVDREAKGIGMQQGTLL